MRKWFCDNFNGCGAVTAVILLVLLFVAVYWGIASLHHRFSTDRLQKSAHNAWCMEHPVQCVEDRKPVQECPDCPDDCLVSRGAGLEYNLIMVPKEMDIMERGNGQERD